MQQETWPEKKEVYEHLPMFWSDLGRLGYEAVGILDPKMKTVSVWEKPKSSDGNYVEPSTKSPDYKKGIVYYLNKEDRVVGVILWNIFGKTEDARKIIKRAEPFVDTNEMKNLISLEETH